jgi:peptidoglycan/xylan/chitin deacetylase (PgdA/CDA1 family)
VPGHTALAYPNLIKEIRDRGHEFAYHGWMHEDARDFDLAAQRPSSSGVCVPKILSGFIDWQNRLNWRDDRADLLCSGLAGLAIQVEEPA